MQLSKQLTEQYSLILEEDDFIKGIRELTKTADILKKYPIKNNAWDYSIEGDIFTAEISTLKHQEYDKPGRGTGGVLTDPWNREFHFMTFAKDRDAEGEIAGWQGTVTVDKVPVKLLVIND